MLVEDVEPAKQRQFGSTTTSWHGLKQAAGFLSLDLKCPHKTKGMHHKISHCNVSNVVFKEQKITELLWEQRRCQICLDYIADCTG